MVFNMSIPLGIKCPDGWTLSGRSCYYLSTNIIKPFSAAVTFCENLGSTLVEVNIVKPNYLIKIMLILCLTI